MLGIRGLVRVVVALSVVAVIGGPLCLEGQAVRRAHVEGQRRLGLGINPQEVVPSVLLVDPGSLADAAGFQVGDVIESVNGRALSEYGSGLGALFGGTEPLRFVVRRGDENLTLRIPGSEPSAAGGESDAPASGSRESEPPNPSFDRDALALELADVLEARYLFPDRGVRYAELLRSNVRSGAYRELSDPVAFAGQVTRDLNELAEDRHLHFRPPGASTGGRVVRRSPGEGAPGARSGAQPGQPSRTVIRRAPGGVGAAMDEPVPESGWLTDDVAFMRIGLMPPDEELKEWAARFMEEHASAAALILDLRMCRGGTVDMMNGFLPYLFGRETHLVTMETRAGAADEVTRDFDEQPELKRAEGEEGVLRWHHTVTPSRTANKPDMPVYVLTGRTGSACEHLTMALQSTGRATVIGARTAGAGHYSTLVDFPAGFTLMLPIGRTYDPRTGMGWELTGIEPDIDIDPNQAESRALELIAERRGVAE